MINEIIIEVNLVETFKVIDTKNDDEADATVKCQFFLKWFDLFDEIKFIISIFASLSVNFQPQVCSFIRVLLLIL